MAQGTNESLVDNIDALRQANSRNSHKGDQLEQFVEREFGLKCQASHTTQQKQIYNRVPEQFKHRADVVIFYVEDERFVEGLIRQVDKRVYEGLKNVLFFYEDNGEVKLRSIIVFEKTNFSEYLLQHFPVENVIEREHKESQRDINIKWGNVGTIKLEDKGLIGLDECFADATAALRAGKHVILVGPPGTGKTALAQEICRNIGAGYSVCTATSDWTTHDTVGGYMPDPGIDVESGEEPLNFFPGLITSAIEDGKWLVIDEINRADVDKAFGEMFTVLSGHGLQLPYKIRDSDGQRSLSIGGQNVTNEEHLNIPLPHYFRLIGTMNTLDKASLYQLSFAFMRRFAFITVPAPDMATLRRMLDTTVASKFKALSVPGSAEYGIEDAYNRITNMLLRLFGTDSQGFASVSLDLGGALALDVFKHIIARYESFPMPVKVEDIDYMLLGALEINVFPQFEGMDEKHTDLVTILSEVCNVTDAEKRTRLAAKLALWTGYQNDE